MHRIGRHEGNLFTVKRLQGDDWDIWIFQAGFTNRIRIVVTWVHTSSIILRPTKPVCWCNSLFHEPPASGDIYLVSTHCKANPSRLSIGVCLFNCFSNLAW